MAAKAYWKGEIIMHNGVYLAQANGSATEYGNTSPKGDSGSGGTTDYSALDNKPQINGTTLQGDKSLSDLGITPIFQGTREDWNRLSTAEKQAYAGGIANFDESDDDLSEAVSELESDVGTLSNLTTTAKNNLVSAVNEVNGKFTWNMWKENEPTDMDTYVQLPSNYNELVVRIKQATNYIMGSHYIPKCALSTTEKGYRSGYCESSQYTGEGLLMISDTQAKGRTIVNGVAGNALLDIYYR